MFRPFQADIALLIVAANEGGFEAGISMEGLTREHAKLAWNLGVEQLIVGINKMDATEPAYSKDRYDQIVKQLGKCLKRLGFQDDDIQYIPISGWNGDNLTKKSDNTSWHTGGTLLNAIDKTRTPEHATDLPLRVHVQKMYKIKGELITSTWPRFAIEKNCETTHSSEISSTLETSRDPRDSRRTSRSVLNLVCAPLLGRKMFRLMFCEYET